MTVGLWVCPETPEGVSVHVVVVVMSDQDSVDGRQVVESDGGRIVTPGTHRTKGTGAIGPDGIDKDVDAGDLDQH